MGCGIIVMMFVIILTTVILMGFLRPVHIPVACAEECVECVDEESLVPILNFVFGKTAQ